MKRKLCVVTGFDDKYHELAKISIPNYLNYVNRHNLDLHISTQNVYPKVGTNYWSPNRHHIIKSILPKYDWILWVDIDCLFIKQSFNVCDLIDDKYNFILGINRNPPFWYTEDTSYLELGIFLMKNDPISFEMLDIFSSEVVDHPWHDQYLVIKTLKENKMYDDVTKKLDLIHINSMYCCNHDIKDTFIFHVAGGSSISFEERIKIMMEKSKYEY